MSQMTGKKICANVSKGISLWRTFPCSQTEIEGYPNTLGILGLFNFLQDSSRQFLKNFPINDF